MVNMSYCRFENTSHDLQDCINALEKAIENGMTFEEFMEDLSSDYEKIGFERMVLYCSDFLDAVEGFRNESKKD